MTVNCRRNCPDRNCRNWHGSIWASRYRHRFCRIDRWKILSAGWWCAPVPVDKHHYAPGLDNRAVQRCQYIGFYCRWWKPKKIGLQFWYNHRLWKMFLFSRSKFPRLFEHFWHEQIVSNGVRRWQNRWPVWHAETSFPSWGRFWLRRHDRAHRTNFIKIQRVHRCHLLFSFHCYFCRLKPGQLQFDSILRWYQCQTNVYAVVLQQHRSFLTRWMDLKPNHFQPWII